MAKQHPNIVYILADDLGYGDVSAFNPESRIHTERIDELSRGGMTFSDAHASSAVCTPSRYSILTGRYCWRTPLKRGVNWGYSPHLIEDDRTTVATFLRGHGYDTACFGKWHLGMDWTGIDGRCPAEGDSVDFSVPIKNGPTTFGFDTFFGISASLDMPPYVYIRNDRPTSLPDRITENTDFMKLWRSGPTGADFFHIDVLPTLQRGAIEYIREHENRERPFFLYFPLPAPHTPILPTADFVGRSGTNIYGDFVLQCDALVGAVMDALSDTGQNEDTIVVFTSDNGCSPRAGIDDLVAMGHEPSYVFRGHKADIYDGGHRIPLMVRWPKTIAAGGLCDHTVCLSDLLSTCSEIVGEALPDDAGEDSVSNLALWRGEDQPIREATVHHSMDGSFAIRKGRWKLEMCPGSGGWSDPRPGEEPQGAPPIQLYDMEEDVGERTNVHDRHPRIVDQLTDLLTRYVKEGRSTPGAPQLNTGPLHWSQLNWLAERDLQ